MQKNKTGIDYDQVADMLEGLVIDSKTFGQKVIIHKRNVYTIEKLIVEASHEQLDLLAAEAFTQEFGMEPTQDNVIIAAKKLDLIK